MPPASVPKINLGELPYATPEETAIFRAAFNKFDADGSGSIDKQELRLCMEELGRPISESDVDAMMQAADTDGNGSVEFSEFAAMMGKRVADDDGEENILAEVFKVFDKDGSGHIDASELHAIFRNLETDSFRSLNTREVDELLKEADTNGDGKISYDEFVKVMVSKANYK